MLYTVELTRPYVITQAVEADDRDEAFTKAEQKAWFVDRSLWKPDIDKKIKAVSAKPRRSLTENERKMIQDLLVTSNVSYNVLVQMLDQYRMDEHKRLKEEMSERITLEDELPF